MNNQPADCEDDIYHRVSVAKWKENSGVFYDSKIPTKLKGKLHTSSVRPALTYGSKSWTMYKTYESKKEASDMEMLRMVAGVTKMDKIKSTRIRGSLQIKEAINQKVDYEIINWYCHVERPEPESVNNGSCNTIKKESKIDEVVDCRYAQETASIRHRSKTEMNADALRRHNHK